MKIKYNAYVKDGRLRIVWARHFKEDVARLEGKRLTITIEQRRKKRSIEQNAYYWGVVVSMIQEGLREVGYYMTKDEAHELVKFKFLRRKIQNKQGETIETLGSTTNMTTVQFEEYILAVKDWALEYLGVSIPDPNEQMEVEFNT